MADPTTTSAVPITVAPTSAQPQPSVTRLPASSSSVPGPTSSSTATSSTSSTTTSTTTAPAPVYLSDLAILADHQYEGLRTGAAKVDGRTSQHSVVIDPPSEQPAYIEYDLSRASTRLRGVVGLSDDAPSGSLLRVEVTGDGWPVFVADVSLGRPTTLDADVTDVLRLRIQVTDLSQTPTTAEAVVVDAMLATASSGTR